MKLLGQKEVTPVLYGGGAVKILPPTELKKEHYFLSPHWHNRMELLYIISGKLMIKIDDTESCVSSGEIAIVPPETTHSAYACADSTAYYTIMFDLDLMCNRTPAAINIFDAIKNHRVKLESHTADKEVVQLLKRLCDIKNADESDALFSEGLLCCVVARLYENGTPIGQAVAADAFGTVTEYIEKHCTEQLTTAELSRHFGYNEAYFCRKFKKQTGLTPSEYINALRLDLAKAELKGSDAKATEIAAKYGFQSYGYFCRLFKKRFGYSPSEYRK